MKRTEKLEVLLEKLRRNKEKVPLEVLKTRYKTAYEELIGNIKVEAMAVLKPVETQLPEWLRDCRIKTAGLEELAGTFNEVYEAGGYARKIGAALFKRYSLQEAEQIAQEVNRKFSEEIIKIFHRHTCLYAAGPSWDSDNPRQPLIYNDFVDKFWDEEAQLWISKEKPPGAAILIFITGEKPEKGAAK